MKYEYGILKRNQNNDKYEWYDFNHRTQISDDKIETKINIGLDVALNKLSKDGWMVVCSINNQVILFRPIKKKFFIF